jgi:Fur family transcriptional regulator, ferric uptake regulator
MNESVFERFKVYLKKDGLKYTKERKVILSEVLKRRDHFDADELAADMRVAGYKVSRATVYRTLDILFEVHKATLGHKHQHYENMVGRKHHDHLICLHCDKVIEFVDEEIERKQVEVCNKLGFEIKRHNLQIFGYCSHCIPLVKDEDNN